MNKETKIQLKWLEEIKNHSLKICMETSLTLDSSTIIKIVNQTIDERNSYLFNGQNVGILICEFALLKMCDTAEKIIRAENLIKESKTES